jgi:benzoate/toluate 1,2-dioxygenase reductase subunit
MSLHRITLVFEDGVTAVVTANEVESVYQAALRQNVQIQTDCREGACATCIGQCTSGRYEMMEFSDEALPPEEQAKGGVLTCRMQARSDCVVALPYPASAIRMAAQKPVTVRVRSVETVAVNVRRLIVSQSVGTPLRFLPGQYVNIAIPGTGFMRSYSFANAPGERDYEFYVRRLPTGLMSEWIDSGGCVGAETTISAPLGQFFLRKADRPVVMVAGGTGLAPMLSMLASMAQTADSPPTKLTVLYGVNHAGEAFGAERIAVLSRSLPITFRRAAVEPNAAWTESTGLVTDLLTPDLLVDGADIYLCGPPGMVTAARRWLDENGHPAHRIFAERFIPAAEAKAA